MAAGPIAITDPDWLYSTAAQSAAALVAIIGGLLATRLLGLAGDRDSLLRQAADLRAERLPLELRHERLRRSTRSVAREWFRDHYVEIYVPSRGVLPSYDEAYWPRGATEDDLREWHDELSAEVARLFDRLDEHSDLAALSRELLSGRGIAAPEFSDDVLDETIKVVNRRRPRSAVDKISGYAVGPLMPTITPAYVIARRDREVDELAQLDMRLSEIRGKADLSASALARVQRPPGMVGGLLALGAFAILGVGFPLALLAWRPVPSGPWIRASVLAAFVAGLGVVIWSMAYQALQLRREPDPQ